MNHTDTVRAATALAVAMMLITAGAGGATATVSSVDTSGTDATSSTSQVQTHTTIQMNNTSQSHIYQVITTNDTLAPVTKVVDNSSGVVTATNASMTNVTPSGTHSEGSHWNATIDERSLVDVEHAIGANVTVEFRAYNNSTDAVADVNTTAHLKFDNATTLQNIDDGDVAAEDVVTVTNDTGPFGATIGPAGTTAADVEEERKVNGSSTDVIIALSNDSAKEMFDEGVSEASSGDKVSNLFSGTRTAATVSDGETTVAVPVYYKSAPDAMGEDDTYAVYRKVGGTWALDVNLGDEFEGANEVTVHAVGSAGATTMLLDYTLNGAGSSMINTGTLLGMVPIVAGRRRRDGVYTDAEADTQAAA